MDQNLTEQQNLSILFQFIDPKFNSIAKLRHSYLNQKLFFAGIVLSAITLKILEAS